MHLAGKQPQIRRAPCGGGWVARQGSRYATCSTGRLRCRQEFTFESEVINVGLPVLQVGSAVGWLLAMCKPVSQPIVVMAKRSRYNADSLCLEALWFVFHSQVPCSCFATDGLCWNSLEIPVEDAVIVGSPVEWSPTFGCRARGSVMGEGFEKPTGKGVDRFFSTGRPARVRYDLYEGKER